MSLVLSNFTAVAYASENDTVSMEEMIDVLVENGYVESTASSLEETDIVDIYNAIEDGSIVDIDTSTYDTDILEEVEAFESYTQDELKAMGYDEAEIEETESQLQEILTMSDSEAFEIYGLTSVETKLIRMAYYSGEEIRETANYNSKEISNEVTASGSISSSLLTFTQSVTSNSGVLPNYSVRISYAWKSVYKLAPFSDKIITAWGGNLNSKSVAGYAYYYAWKDINSSFSSYQKCVTMSSDVTPNVGIEFTFPQSSGINSTYGTKNKTKIGYARFVVYQTKSQGYDTTLMSYYLHRVISVKSASVSLSASGPSVSISIGGAWDKSKQCTSILSY